MEIAKDTEGRIKDLYNASQKGCVPTLNKLLQQDPFILLRLSSPRTLPENPLHISAFLGHLEFTKTLVADCPKLALELDSSQRTPLHLASAQGHIDIVKELLLASKEACLVRDQEHRIPLHHAVIRGKRDVVLELIRAKPESLKILDDKGKTIFHLCVMHNQLQILKDLVDLDPHDTHGLLNKTDLDGGNTILHLAIMLKQVETVGYLISIPKIRSEASNLKNDMGQSAADIVDGMPRDSKGIEIQDKLMEYGIKCGKKKWWSRNVVETIDEWLLYNGNRLDNMRGNLCTVATVISTMSFQASLNPPGSFIQQGIIQSGGSDSNSSTLPQGQLTCLSSFRDQFGKKHVPGPCPGEAMLGYVNPPRFHLYIIYNSISFISSLCVALLLVSGAPPKRHFVSWLISQGLGLSISTLISAYLLGIDLVTPYSTASYMIILAFVAVHCLHALVGVYIVVRFFIWVMKKLKEKRTI